MKRKPAPKGSEHIPDVERRGYLSGRTSRKGLTSHHASVCRGGNLR